MDQPIPSNYTPSITTSTTSALAALMRLGRRMRPLVELAQKELDRRYRGESARRNREKRKIFRQIARENAHQPELIRAKVLAAIKEKV